MAETWQFAVSLSWHGNADEEEPDRHIVDIVLQQVWVAREARVTPMMGSQSLGRLHLETA
jgi:hypothetical protein